MSEQDSTRTTRSPNPTAVEWIVAGGGTIAIAALWVVFAMQPVEQVDIGTHMGEMFTGAVLALVWMFGSMFILDKIEVSWNAK